MKSPSKQSLVPLRAVPGNRLGHRLGHYLLPGLLGAAALGTAARPAHAGEWVLEKYIYNGEQKQFTTKYHGSPTDGNAYWYSKDFMEPVPAVRGEVPGTEPNVALRGSWSVTPSYLNGTVAPDGTWEQHRDPKLGHAQVDGWVRAELRWIRNTDENGDPDPNDNPPDSVWIWEQARATVVRSHTRPNNDPAPNNETLYDAGNPYGGGLFEAPSISCTLGSKDPQVSPVVKSQGGGATLYGSVTDTVIGKNLYRQDTGGRDVIPLSAAHFYVNVQATNPGWYDLKSQVADIRCEYVASPVFFNVLSRRKGSGLPFGSATIEAGAVGTDEHKADIQVQVVDWRSNPVAELPLSLLPKLEFLPDTQKGVAVAATLLNPVEDGEIQYDPTAKTDGDGKVLAGVALSRDLTNTNGNVSPVIVQLDTGKGAKPSNAVNHTWGSVEWKMGESGEKDYNPEFYIPDENGYKEWIWTKVKGVDDLPLTGHDLKFSARRLVVKVEDPQTQEIITKIFTTDSAEAAQDTQAHAGDESYQVICKQDIDDDVKDYITLPSPVESAPGIYKGQLTIQSATNFSVEEYALKLKDLRVFYRTAPAA